MAPLMRQVRTRFARALRRPLRRWRPALPLSLQPLEDRAVPSAAVQTDKDDYGLGETVQITATGFTLGETVAFQVLHIDGRSNDGADHDPWFVVDGGAGDVDGAADGSISTSWYVGDPDALGSTFQLTADGQASTEHAAVTFTDADNVGPATQNLLVAPSPTKVAPTITATIDDSGNRGNSAIVAAEYFITSTGANGSGTAMAASDGNFNNKSEAVTAKLTATQFNGLQDGTYTVFVHGKDAAGNWGPFASATFVKGNTAPVASGQSVSTNEDNAKAITLSATDSDGDVLSYTVVTGPSHGKLSGSGANRTYTPDANYFGSDSFTFEVNDGVADSNTATVSISVNAVDDAPVIGSFNTTPKLLKNTTVTITVPATDVDSSKLTYTLSGAPSWASIDKSAGVLTLSPGLDDSSATFSVVVDDNDGQTASQAVSVSVYSAGVKGNNLHVYGTSGNNSVHTTTHSPTIVTIDGVQQTILLADGSTADSYDVLGSGGYIVIDAGNGTNDVSIEGMAPAVVFGGNGVDNITGGGGGDILAGGNGADVLNGDGGSDLIIGGRGPDTITGGSGTNRIYGGMISADALNSLGLPADIVALLTARNDVVDGVSSETDTIVESGDFDFALTDTSLDAGNIHDILTSVEVANLTGGSSANSFTVSGWTGTGTLNADGSSDTLVAVKNTNFTLTNSSIATTDGMSLGLSGFDSANLTGGASSTSYNLTGWTGSATVDTTAHSAAVSVDSGAGTIALASSLANLTLVAPGDVTVGVITTPSSGAVTITAGGAIIDGNGAADNITTGTLTLSATAGIGAISAGDNGLETNAAVLWANNTTSGDLAIVNQQTAHGALLITRAYNNGGAVRVENFGDDTHGITVGKGAVVHAATTIDLISHSPLVIDTTSQVTSAGNISFDAANVIIKPGSTITSTGGSLGLATANADFSGANLGSTNLNFTKDSASLTLVGSTFGNLDYSGTGTTTKGATFDLAGASFGKFTISHDAATNMTFFGDVSGAIYVNANNAHDMSFAGGISNGIYINGDAATNMSFFGDAATALSIFGDSATNFSFLGDSATALSFFGDHATELTFLGDIAHASFGGPIFIGDQATNISFFGDAATAINFFGDHATAINFFGDVGGGVAVTGQAVGRLVNGDVGTAINFFGDVAQGVSIGLADSAGKHIGTTGDFATNIHFHGDVATSLSFAGDSGTAMSFLGDHATAISIFGDHATNINFLGDVATNLTFAGDNATSMSFLGDFATAINIFGDFATNINFAGDVGTNLTFLGDSATAMSFKGDIATSLNFVGDAATAINFAGDIGTNLTFLGDSATNVSFLGDSATQVSFLGDAATAISFMGDVHGNVFVSGNNVGDTATAISMFGDQATYLSFLGDNATAISFFGDNATALSFFGDHATAINFFGDVNGSVQFGTPTYDSNHNIVDHVGGDHATNMNFLGDVATSLSFSGDSATAVSFLGDHATAISFFGDSATNINFFDDIATTVNFLGDAATAINFNGDIATMVNFFGDSATNINFFGDIATTLNFAGDHATAMNFLGDHATTINFLGDNATNLSFMGDIATNVSFAGDTATSLSFAGDFATAINFVGDHATNLSFAGDIGTNISFVGDAATTVSFLGDHATTISFFGDHATNISFVGDIATTVSFAGDTATAMSFQGDFATAINFVGDFATNLSFVGDVGTAITFFGDTATAINFVGDIGTNLTFLGDSATTVSFLGDTATQVSFLGDAATAITFFGDINGDLFFGGSHIGDTATAMSFFGDSATYLSFLGDHATAISFVGDVSGTVIVGQDHATNVSFLGDYATNIVVDGDVGGSVAILGNHVSNVTVTGDIAQGTFIEGSDINGLHFTGTQFGHTESASGPSSVEQTLPDVDHLRFETATQDSSDIINGLILISGNNVSGLDFGGSHATFLGVIAITGDNASNITFTGNHFEQATYINGDNASNVTYKQTLNAGDTPADKATPHGGDFIINGDYASNIKYLADADAGSMLIWGGHATGVTYKADLAADAAVARTGAALLIYGDAASGVTYQGGRGNDTLMIFGTGANGVAFDGSTGNDYIVLAGDQSTNIGFTGGTGDDTAVVTAHGVAATLDGGSGANNYIIAGDTSGSLSVTEASSAVDTLNFSSFQRIDANGNKLNSGVSVDLSNTVAQNINADGGKTLSMTLSSNGITNVVGSAYNDTIWGNNNDNNMYGADLPSAAQAAGSTWDGRVQVVYLNFTTFDDEIVGNAIPQHTYSQAERDAIQARIEAAYEPFNDAFGTANSKPFVFTQSQPPSGEYATLYFNRTPPTGGGPGGEASEVDARNVNLGGYASIQVNGILGNPDQPPEYYAAGTTTAVTPNASLTDFVDADGNHYSADHVQNNWIVLAAKIGAHELGHLVGMRHQDAFGPIGYGIHSPPGADRYHPAYPGAAAAFETFNHLISSGDSVGSNRFIDVDPNAPLFFGEREAIKLAFALSGTTVNEQAGAHSTNATAQTLTLAPLTVPNAEPRGINANKDYVVSAVAVTGAIQLDGNGHSVADVYSFTGKAGDMMTIEVQSASLARLNGDVIDPTIQVFDENGNLVAYYTSINAFNDDQFEPNDSTILDLKLPSDGTFYVKVNTFADGQHGQYELMMYSFAAHNKTSGDDTFHITDDNTKFNIDGGDGANTLIFDVNVTINGSGPLGYSGKTTPGGTFSNVSNIVGTGGVDTLNGEDVASIWTLAPGGYTYFDGNAFGKKLTFSGFENLNGGKFADTFNISTADTQALSIKGGLGGDTFNFLAGGSTTAAIDGQGGIDHLSYSGRATGVTITVAGAVAGDYSGTATDIAGGFSGINDVVGSGGADTLVNSSGADGAFTVSSANAGTFGFTGSGGALTFSAIENLTGDNTGNDAFSVNAAIGNLSGLGGNDSFKLNTGGSAGTITGGTGTDHLNYAGRGTSITVTVTSGASGDYTGNSTSTAGFSGINEVVGSSATDGLVNSSSQSGTFNVTTANAGDFGFTGSGAVMTFSAMENLTGDNAGNDAFNIGAAIGNLAGLGGDDTFSLNTGGSTGSVDGGAGTDRLNYAGRGTAVTVTVTGGTAGEYSGTATSTGGFSGVNDLVGSTNSDTLVNSSGQNGTFNVTASMAGNFGFTGSGVALTFASVENLTGDNTSNDTFNINAAIVDLYGLGGDDSFYMNAGGSTGGVNAGAGTDHLNYSGRSTAVTFTMGGGSGGEYGGTSDNTAGFSGINDVVGSTSGADLLANSSGADGTFTVTAANTGTFAVTGSGAAMTFSAVENLTGDNAGNDAFNIGAAIGNLSGLGGNDSFNLNAGGSTGAIAGGAGTDHLSYAGRGTAVTVTVTGGASGEYSGTATDTAGFAGINDVVGSTAVDSLVNGSGQNGAFNVTAANAGSFAFTGSGTAMTFSGVENLTGDTADDAFNIGAKIGNLSGLGGNDTFYLNTGGSAGAIDGGAGTDHLNYSGRATAVTVAITGGSGGEYSGTATDAAGFSGINDVVGSGASTDTLNVTSNSNFTLTNASLTIVGGDLPGTLSFSSIEVANLTGGASNNNFDVSGWTGGGKLDGLAGTDAVVAAKDKDFTLSDTSLSSSDGMYMTLAGIERGFLTRLDATTSTIGKIDASAFSGNAVLVGTIGADKLTGAKGRSILIGGGGADTLSGPTTGTGNDDIIVAGTTSYDTNLVAQTAILNEWVRTDLSYQNRVNDVMVVGSSGLNGSYVLYKGSGSTGTVFDDGTNVVDTMTGGLGTDLFFYANKVDNVTDKTSSEKLVQLNNTAGGQSLLADGSDGSTDTNGLGTRASLHGGPQFISITSDDGESLPAAVVARIEDALVYWNATFGSLGTTFVAVDAACPAADFRIVISDTSVCGGLADGVLGCFDANGTITLIRGWNWYTGADASQVGSAQYDLQTIMSHELGHALGLGHSTDNPSVMYPYLQTAVAKRVLTADDLENLDEGGGSDALYAARPVAAPQGTFTAVTNVTFDPTTAVGYVGRAEVTQAEFVAQPLVMDAVDRSNMPAAEVAAVRNGVDLRPTSAIAQAEGTTHVFVGETGANAFHATLVGLGDAPTAQQPAAETMSHAGTESAATAESATLIPLDSPAPTLESPASPESSPVTGGSGIDLLALLSDRQIALGALVTGAVAGLIASRTERKEERPRRQRRPVEKLS